MTDLAIPEGPEGFTPDWLSAALGETVASVEVTRIGQDQGFMGGCLFRLATHDRSVVAKLSPVDPDMRMRFAKSNGREVTFYQTLAGGLPVPHCYYGNFDADTGASVLVLEDLGAARAVPYLDGLWQEDVDAVLSTFAEIHASWWQAPALANLSGADTLSEFSLPDAWALYPEALAKLLPDVKLPERFMALGEAAARNVNEVYQQLQETGPLTALHRDPQLDNILFDADNRAILLDWQLLGKGRGVWDVAYFLISSVPPALRRSNERAWVAAYHADLLARGIQGYDLETCWRDYLRSVMAKLFVTVWATVYLDNNSAHKRAYRRVDLTRLLAFVEDHQLTPEIWNFTHD